MYRLILLGLFCGALGHRLLPGDDLPSFDLGMKPGKFPKGDYPESGHDPFYDNMTVPYVPGLDKILPAKHKPGELIDSIAQNDVNRALDDVVNAGKLMHDRGCAIAISNEAGEVLENPRFWLYTGMSFAAAPPEVELGKTALNLYVKKDWQATGTVGVMTYDIRGTDFKVAVLWSVPFDFNIWDLWYNIKVYPKDYPTEGHMYIQMYYHAGPWRPSGWDSRVEHGVKLRATMTHNIQAKLMVWVDSSNLDPEGPVELSADCSYHAGWVKNYCWKECHTGGTCWVNKRCGKASDCSGHDPCYEPCWKTRD